MQFTIVEILMKKLVKAAKHEGINEIAIAGGVSANSGLRNAVKNGEKIYGWNTYIPDFQFTTDNAAMIAITGLLKYQKGEFSDQKVTPYTQSLIK